MSPVSGTAQPPTLQGTSEVAEKVARSISADPTELSVSFNEYL